MEMNKIIMLEERNTIYATRYYLCIATVLVIFIHINVHNLLYHLRNAHVGEIGGRVTQISIIHFLHALMVMIIFLLGI